jgi:NAD(P)H dehydrogenase (quinone)
MCIVVTGATGNLGGLVVDALIRRGMATSEIVAAGRNRARLAELATKGVRTVRYDVDDVESVAAAFDGARKVLLVSIPGSPRRFEQHRGAIDAAKAAGVELFVYTSFIGAAPTNHHADHYATEQLLRENAMPYVVLRNGVYFEFFTAQINEWREQGQVLGAAGDGRISAAAIADLADAAAVVLTTPGHERAVYELGIDDPFTMPELANELSRQTGTQIPYVPLSVEEFETRLLQAGSTGAAAARRANVDRTIASGEFFIDTGDLGRLVGRELVTLSGAIAGAIGR